MKKVDDILLVFGTFAQTHFCRAWKKMKEKVKRFRRFWERQSMWCESFETHNANFVLFFSSFLYCKKIRL